MKALFLANFLPDTNYTRDLSTAFYRVMQKGDVLYLCGRMHEPVSDGYEPGVDQVWKRGNLFFIRVLRYIQRKKPDIIHVQHEFKTYGGIMSAAILPVFILLLRFLGYPVVVTFHGIVSPKQLDKKFLEGFGVRYNVLTKYLVIAVFRYIYGSIGFLANAITVHTPFLRDILVSDYALKKETIHVIAHGVRKIPSAKDGMTNPLILRKYPALRNKHIITVFGYFSPRKGYEFLLQAFRTLLSADPSYGTWTLVLAGDVTPEYTYYKERIVQLIGRLRLRKNVVITGFVDKQDIDELYRMTNIVLIPAIYSFNTSGALSIALAYKKPIVVADVKPLADEIRQNKFGMLYDPSSTYSCVRQLRKIIDNKKLYASLLSSLDASVKLRYWTPVAKTHYRLYEKILYNR